MRITAICLALLSLTFSNAFASNRPHSPDRLIVKLKKNVQIDGLKLRKLFGQVYVAQVQNAESTYDQLKSHPGVEYVEFDYFGTQDKLAKEVPVQELEFSKATHASPFNDPGLSRQWSFRDSQDHGMSVSEAYLNRRSEPKESIVVAVVDTGVDYTHEDLPMWVNEGEIADNGIDDDQNGYIDDIYGINTLVRDSDGNATVDMRDTHSHGTHVSGIIGAVQNNNIGIAGVASNVKIMGIRTVPNRSDERDVDVIEAFLYAAKNGARIINCSFGKDHNEGGMAVSEAIEHIGNEYGVLVVAAAGNSSRDIDTRLTYPASFPNSNLMVVASTTSRGGMSYFSNYGENNVDLAAPGSGIYSTVPGDRYSNMSGTSMASPNAAGVAAEVLSHYPELTAIELKEILMRSVSKIGRFSTRMVSGGRIDLDKALEMAHHKHIK